MRAQKPWQRKHLFNLEREKKDLEFHLPPHCSAAFPLPPYFSPVTSLVGLLLTVRPHLTALSLLGVHRSAVLLGGMLSVSDEN